MRPLITIPCTRVRRFIQYNRGGPARKRRLSHRLSETKNLPEVLLYGNLGDKAPSGQASMHAMHKIHSESLNFFQSKSIMGICMGQAVSHSLHSEHFTGSRCIPNILFFWVTDIIAPTGQM